MYDLDYYETSSGNIPLKDFLSSFDKGDEKALSKVHLYMNMLAEYGPDINKMFKREASKKIDDELFELRPSNRRILFFYYSHKKIILLHGFTKKTRRTPTNQIIKANEEMNNYKERHK